MHPSRFPRVGSRADQPEGERLHHFNGIAQTLKLLVADLIRAHEHEVDEVRQELLVAQRQPGPYGVERHQGFSTSSSSRDNGEIQGVRSAPSIGLATDVQCEDLDDFHQGKPSAGVHGGTWAERTANRLEDKPQQHPNLVECPHAELQSMQYPSERLEGAEQLNFMQHLLEEVRVLGQQSQIQQRKCHRTLRDVLASECKKIQNSIQLVQVQMQQNLEQDSAVQRPSVLGQQNDRGEIRPSLLLVQPPSTPATGERPQRPSVGVGPVVGQKDTLDDEIELFSVGHASSDADIDAVNCISTDDSLIMPAPAFDLDSNPSDNGDDETTDEFFSEAKTNPEVQHKSEAQNRSTRTSAAGKEGSLTVRQASTLGIDKHRMSKDVLRQPLHDDTIVFQIGRAADGSRGLLGGRQTSDEGSRQASRRPTFNTDTLGTPEGIRNSANSHLKPVAYNRPIRLSSAGSHEQSQTQSSMSEQASGLRESTRGSDFRGVQSDVGDPNYHLNPIWMEEKDTAPRNSSVFLGFVDLQFELEDNHEELEPGRCECLWSIWTSFAERLMMKPNDPKHFCWDAIGLLLIAVDCVVVPLLVFDLPDIAVMSWTIRMFWSLNIVKMLLTGYINADGTTETRPQKVLINYASTWLLLDLLVVCCDWIEYVNEVEMTSVQKVGTAFRSLRLIRTVRLFRLLRAPEITKVIMEYIPFTEQLSVVMTIFNIMFVFLWTTHVVACLWYLVGRIGDQMRDNNWIKEYDNNIQAESLATKYTICLYWSMGTFSGETGLIEPVNTGERIFATCLLFLAFVVAASYVGSITTSMTRLQIIASEQSSKLAALRRYLLDHQISRPLAVRIQRNAMHALLEMKAKAPESSVELLRFISAPVMVELHFEIYFRVLEVHLFFSIYNDVNSNGIRKVCHQAITQLSLHKGDVLFHDLEVPSHPRMYFLVNGFLNYMQPGKNIPVKQGGYLSEPALWTKWRHCGTARALNETRFLLIDAEKFAEIISKFPSNHASTYAAEYVKWLNTGRLEKTQTDICAREAEIKQFLTTSFPEDEDSDDSGDIGQVSAASSAQPEARAGHSYSGFAGAATPIGLAVKSAMGGLLQPPFWNSANGETSNRNSIGSSNGGPGRLSTGSRHSKLGGPGKSGSGLWKLRTSQRTSHSSIGTRVSSKRTGSAERLSQQASCDAGSDDRQRVRSSYQSYASLASYKSLDDQAGMASSKMSEQWKNTPEALLKKQITLAEDHYELRPVNTSQED